MDLSVYYPSKHTTSLSHFTDITTLIAQKYMLYMSFPSMIFSTIIRSSSILVIIHFFSLYAMFCNPCSFCLYCISFGVPETCSVSFFLLILLLLFMHQFHNDKDDAPSLLFGMHIINIRKKRLLIITMKLLSIFSLV